MVITLSLEITNHIFTTTFIINQREICTLQSVRISSSNVCFASFGTKVQLKEKYCDFYPLSEISDLGLLSLLRSLSDDNGVNPNLLDVPPQQSQYSTLLYSTLDLYLQFLCIVGGQTEPSGSHKACLLPSSDAPTHHSWLWPHFTINTKVETDHCYVNIFRCASISCFQVVSH